MATTQTAIRFRKHFVADRDNKARVFYSLDNRHDGRKCVTLYAKDYGHTLGEILGDDVYRNDTDSMTDYFDKGRVVLFETHPCYAAARTVAEQV